MTKLRLANPTAIKDKAAEINRIGASINDPKLFKRIEEACLNQQAFLFVSPDGFLVLKPVTGPGVLVWAAHSIRKTNRLTYFFEIEQFARDINAQHVTFLSRRKGFHKIAPLYGYSPRPDVWMERPITVWIKHL